MFGGHLGRIHTVPGIPATQGSAATGTWPGPESGPLGSGGVDLFPRTRWPAASSRDAHAGQPRKIDNAALDVWLPFHRRVAVRARGRPGHLACPPRAMVAGTRLCGSSAQESALPLALRRNQLRRRRPAPARSPRLGAREMCPDI
eukprot:scaffold1318_cov388-Prasinococcus_capsulatus_cf.AAC.68